MIVTTVGVIPRTSALIRLNSLLCVYRSTRRIWKRAAHIECTQQALTLPLLTAHMISAISHPFVLFCLLVVSSPCPICRLSYLSFAPSSSLSAFAAPLLNCSGCGLSLLCQRCCSTADVTSVLGDALEHHSGRMCSQQPSFGVEHAASSLSAVAGSGLLQQLRLQCGGCGMNEVVQM